MCVPKITGPSDVERLASVIDRLEQARHLTSQSVSIMPLVECAEALLAVAQIARTPRVLRLQMGELDLAADLGLEVAADEAELLASRAGVVTASAAAKLCPPVGAVSADLHNVDAFERSTHRLRRLGFFGRAAIHPIQLPIIHAVLSSLCRRLRQRVDWSQPTMRRGRMVSGCSTVLPARWLTRQPSGGVDGS